ncbi:hypothetical protein PCAR4_110012 [Paraburkholderia caribensis]|nr:hypothetical protein PCAR4_110012 [Paraburkholderia caribensis]
MVNGLLQFFGSPTWARTRDLRINSPALYRLSYRGTTTAEKRNCRRCRRSCQYPRIISI